MEWENWKHQEETQQLLKWLADQRDELKEDWASGQYVGDNWVTQTGKNAEALGRANQLGEVISTIVDEPEKMEVVNE